MSLSSNKPHGSVSGLGSLVYMLAEFYVAKIFNNIKLNKTSHQSMLKETGNTYICKTLKRDFLTTMLPNYSN